MVASLVHKLQKRSGHLRKSALRFEVYLNKKEML